jgi:hypothetical protein
MRLNAAPTQLRLESVWRNGYGSADYDSTVDRSSYRLSGFASGGQQCRTASRSQLPTLRRRRLDSPADFDSMKAEDSGKANSFDLSMAEELEKFG